MTVLPHVFAHRGASSFAPGNTIAAFSKAMEVGARWFEFDVDTIADGALIVIHDNRLDRTTNGRDGYYMCSFSDTRGLDVGAWFSDTHRFERTPEAVDAISLGNRQHMGVNLEIKPCRGGIQLCECLIEALTIAVDSVHNKDRFIVPSFDHELLAAFYKARPQISLGRFLDFEKQSTLGWQEGASALGCPAVHPDAKGLVKEEVWKIRDCGFDCNVWTVNNLEQAKGLASWGVAGVSIDYPQSFPAEALAL